MSYNVGNSVATRLFPAVIYIHPLLFSNGALEIFHTELDFFSTNMLESVSKRCSTYSRPGVAL